MINIWGKYKDGKPEKLDQASSDQEAMRLLGEYQIAFGKDWSIWKGRKDAGSTSANTVEARRLRQR